jgi:mannose-6-phosphate isomerase-like protein (cupin superfamily)
MSYFVDNIEKLTQENNNFRKVLFTNPNGMQLVLMTLKPNEDIGEEVHNDVDQFIRIESGTGSAKLNNVIYPITDGFAVLIPKGTKHNIINSGKGPMKIYSLYCPPEHTQNRINIDKPKEDHHQSGGSYYEKYMKYKDKYMKIKK